ncbi:PP2C family serine/threonine-protein phosphatase [Virgibacillus halophilus]|uniref:PP2C family serine/threonine-protein phosphatase n=1 Tax=Tigheibacillus halophilus TaxID=361280 RepID=A0ABU5C3E0_9BACI|nr:PP2C family serine/threonine-protein phosphatase [Virgibacillus halophilus]
MFRKKSPCKRECEDSFVINDHLGIYGVMDGATPVDHFKDEAGHNGAYLAANIFKNYFESLQAASHLHHEVLQANRLLKQAMESHGVDQAVKPSLWSTCVSVVRITDNMLKYASLGDTMILICNNQDEINVLTVNTVKNISVRARMNRELARDNGKEIPKETYFNNERNKISYHREMANMPNGYAVANGMDEVKYYIQHGMLPVKDLKQALIMSDGLFDAKDDLREVYWEIHNNGLENFVQKLSLKEEQSNSHSDDKTAVLLTFH